MKFFNTQEIEENVDYLLSVSELGNDWATGLVNAGTKSFSQIIDGFKETLIIWYFYTKISNQEENYELSDKIRRVIELEKLDAIEQLLLKGGDERIIENFVNEIDIEIRNLMLN